jgi:hypothetical protein
MHALLNSNWLTVAFASVIQLAIFVRWVYRRIRNDEITRLFLEDMATHHLPHIYELLGKLCDQQGIKRAPLPPVQWIDLSHREHHT